MENKKEHCQTCRCFAGRDANHDQTGVRVFDIAKCEIDQALFHAAVLKFAHDRHLTFSQMCRDIGIGRQALENFVYAYCKPRFSTVSKIYKYMKDNGVDC